MYETDEALTYIVARLGELTEAVDRLTLAVMLTEVGRGPDPEWLVRLEEARVAAKLTA